MQIYKSIASSEAVIQKSLSQKQLFCSVVIFVCLLIRFFNKIRITLNLIETQMYSFFVELKQNLCLNQ